MIPPISAKITPSKGHGQPCLSPEKSSRFASAEFFGLVHGCGGALVSGCGDGRSLDFWNTDVDAAGLGQHEVTGQREGDAAGGDDAAFDVIDVEFVGEAVVKVAADDVEILGVGVGADCGLGGDDCGHFLGGGGMESGFSACLDLSGEVVGIGESGSGEP